MFNLSISCELEHLHRYYLFEKSHRDLHSVDKACGRRLGKKNKREACGIIYSPSETYCLNLLIDNSREKKIFNSVKE